MIRSRKFNNYKWHYEDNADKYINILNENLEESILKIDVNKIKHIATKTKKFFQNCKNRDSGMAQSPDINPR